MIYLHTEYLLLVVRRRSSFAKALCGCGVRVRITSESNGRPKLTSCMATLARLALKKKINHNCVVTMHLNHSQERRHDAMPTPYLGSKPMPGLPFGLLCSFDHNGAFGCVVVKQTHECFEDCAYGILHKCL